jgi:hypothetical protein
VQEGGHTVKHGNRYNIDEGIRYQTLFNSALKFGDDRGIEYHISETSYEGGGRISRLIQQEEIAKGIRSVMNRCHDVACFHRYPRVPSPRGIEEILCQKTSTPSLVKTILRKFSAISLMSYITWGRKANIHQEAAPANRSNTSLGAPSCKISATV